MPVMRGGTPDLLTVRSWPARLALSSDPAPDGSSDALGPTAVVGFKAGLAPDERELVAAGRCRLLLMLAPQEACDA